MLIDTINYWYDQPNILNSTANNSVAYTDGMTNPPYTPEKVGERIKMVRKAHGLSQVKFGEAISQPASAVSNWERGAQRPGIPIAEEMARRFGITLDWLFLGRSETLQYSVAQALLAQTGETPQI